MLLKRTHQGICVRVREDESRLLSFNPTTIQNISGARVTMSARGSMVSLEAQVPDTEERFRWRFEVSDDESELVESPLELSELENLQAMVGELRVALNGSL